MIQLWMEGYCITGNSASAQFCGTYSVATLKEAIIEWCKEDPDRKRYVDFKKMSYWGCKFFASEAEARKSFG